MVWLTPFPKGIVKEYIDIKKQTQSAGFDLTVREILRIKDGGILDFDNGQRVIPEYEPLPSHSNIWELTADAYIVRYNEIISVPSDSVAIILPRSSLMRMGATIYSALWDPGYNGRGIGLLHVTKKISVHKNARIAQIIFIRTEGKAAQEYAGQYQNEGI